jgi:hypothetical protein
MERLSLQVSVTMAVSRQSREVAMSAIALKYHGFGLPMRNRHCEAFCRSNFRGPFTQNVETERGDDLLAIGKKPRGRMERGGSR